MGELVVKVKPDTTELDKELKKKRSFSGLLGLGGVGGGSKKGKEDKKATDDIVSELKSIKGKVGITAVIIGALWIFIKPVLELVKAVSALFFLIFSPILIPALKGLVMMFPLLRSIAEFLRSIFQKAFDFVDQVVDFMTGIYVSIWDEIVATWELIKAAPKWLMDNIIVPGFEIFLGIGKWLFENIILPGFKALLSAGSFIFDKIVKGFNFLFDVGQKIWDKVIKPGFDFFVDVGQRIWDIIKSPFETFKTLFKTAINSISSFINSLIPGTKFDIPELANGGIVTKPTLAVIGERGPEAVIPLNGGSGGAGMTFSPTIIVQAANQNTDARGIGETIGRIGAEELSRRTGSMRI